MVKEKKGQTVPGNQEGKQNQGSQSNRDNQRNESASAEKGGRNRPVTGGALKNERANQVGSQNKDQKSNKGSDKRS